MLCEGVGVVGEDWVVQKAAEEAVAASPKHMSTAG